MYNSLRQLFYCNIQVHRSINCFLLSLARTSISFLPFLRGTSFIRIYNRLLLNILYVINQKYGLNL